MMTGRLTGLQAGQVGIVAQLEALRQTMGPREWVVLLELLARWLERERERNTRRRQP